VIAPGKLAVNEVGERADRPEGDDSDDVWPRRYAAGLRVGDEPEREEAEGDGEIEERAASSRKPV
jgi:hypothetical protein